MAMTRRERLLNTFRGKPVDRPPVSFYEVDYYLGAENDPDPYNILNDPSWKPLLDLVREKVDRLVNHTPPLVPDTSEELDRLTTSETREEGGVRITRGVIRTPAGRDLAYEHRREREVNTVWATSHPVKSPEDLEAWLSLPEDPVAGVVDVSAFLAAERELADDGLMLLDTGDPLCLVAELMSMEDYTVIALTEQALFHRALERASRLLLKRMEKIAAALPGRPWRICGPEYALPPYLPPALFREYVARYDRRLVELIHRHGGWARMHAHGRVSTALAAMVELGCDATDPLEPPPQGDVRLLDVRREYGGEMALFGNLESSDLENLPTPAFRGRIQTALAEGAAGGGRGFVLMPSACPYGRKLSALALANYEAMIEEIERL